jgi:protein-S-isoprenylcysteine O-methyltransferase Ste14
MKPGQSGDIASTDTASGRDRVIRWLLLVLIVAAFPVNPFVELGIVSPARHAVLKSLGTVTFVSGMLLTFTPLILFPRKGGVPKGRPFYETTLVVDSGPYAILRHPYLFGVTLGIFVTSALWHPHPLFFAMGIAGASLCYLGAIQEERELVARLGEDYVRYMDRVPRMNIVLGLAGLIRRRRQQERAPTDSAP